MVIFDILIYDGLKNNCGDGMGLREASTAHPSRLQKHLPCVFMMDQSWAIGIWATCIVFI